MARPQSVLCSEVLLYTPIPFVIMNVSRWRLARPSIDMNEWMKYFIWVTRKMPGLIRPMSHWKWVQNNGKYTGYRFKSWVLVLYMLYKCFPIILQWLFALRMYINLSIGVRKVKEVSKLDKQLKKVERRCSRAGHNITKWNSDSTVSDEQNSMDNIVHVRSKTCPEIISHKKRSTVPPVKVTSEAQPCYNLESVEGMHLVSLWNSM